MVAGIVGFVAGVCVVLFALAALRSHSAAANAEVQESRAESISPRHEAEVSWKRALAEERCLQAEFGEVLFRHRREMDRVRMDELRLRRAAFGGP